MLARKSPYKTLTSDKPEKVVAQCVQFAWQDEAVFGVDAGAYLQPGKKGGSTVYTRSAESFVDVSSDASGTALSYYAQKDDFCRQAPVGGVGDLFVKIISLMGCD
jgi:hypothetical protein